MLHGADAAAFGAGLGFRADSCTALGAGIWGLWVATSLIGHDLVKFTIKVGSIQFFAIGSTKAA